MIIRSAAEKGLIPLGLLRDAARALVQFNRELAYSRDNGIDVQLASHFVGSSATKEGDVCFVLGGSQSINSLSSEAWRQISNGCSIGINNWFVHPFVPTYLLVEGWRAEELSSAPYDHFIESLGSYLQQEKVTLLIKNLGIHYFPLSELNLASREEVYGVPKLSIPGQSNSVVSRVMRMMSIFRMQNYFTLFSRVSVVMAISIGYLMGYKKIVLCGVDLNDGKYFWEEPGFKPHPAVTCPPSSGQPTVSRHSTVNPKINPVTADASIVSFNAHFLKPSGVSLFIASDESKLSSHLKTYQFMK